MLIPYNSYIRKGATVEACDIFVTQEGVLSKCKAYKRVYSLTLQVMSLQEIFDTFGKQEFRSDTSQSNYTAQETIEFALRGLENVFSKLGTLTNHQPTIRYDGYSVNGGPWGIGVGAWAGDMIFRVIYAQINKMETSNPTNGPPQWTIKSPNNFMSINNNVYQAQYSFLEGPKVKMFAGIPNTLIFKYNGYWYLGKSPYTSSAEIPFTTTPSDTTYIDGDYIRSKNISTGSVYRVLEGSKTRYAIGIDGNTLTFLY